MCICVIALHSDERDSPTLGHCYRKSVSCQAADCMARMQYKSLWCREYNSYVCQTHSASSGHLAADVQKTKWNVPFPFTHSLATCLYTMQCIFSTMTSSQSWLLLPVNWTIKPSMWAVKETSNSIFFTRTTVWTDCFSGDFPVSFRRM